MLGEVMGRLTDDGYIHEVVEQLEEADRSASDSLPMRSRRTPQPTLKPAAESLVGHNANVATHSRTHRPCTTHEVALSASRVRVGEYAIDALVGRWLSAAIGSARMSP